MRALVRPLLAGLLGLWALAAAGDAAPAGPQAPAPTPVPTPAATPARQEQEIEDFVPTEKVGADDAVSFPTDI
jgi:hypothetical protein